MEALLPAAFRVVDHYGENVDWLLLYKIPANAKLSGNLSSANSGSHYLSFSSRSKLFYLNGNLINDEKSSLLQQTLRESSKFANYHVCYNDNSAKGDKAHAKGFLWFNGDMKSAIWVIHSMPCYNPDPKNDATWKVEHAQLKFGQMLFIAHLNGTSNIKKAYHHITRLRCKLQNSDEGEKKLRDTFEVHKSQITSIEEIMVHVGRNSSCEMKIFLKAREVKGDIYEYWNPDGIVGTHHPGYLKNLFNSGILSTRCGGCEPGKIMPKKDMQYVTVQVANNGSISWGRCTNPGAKRSAIHHSKFSFSDVDFCLGDLNRDDFHSETGQGGLACIQCEALTSAFKFNDEGSAVTITATNVLNDDLAVSKDVDLNIIECVIPLLKLILALQPGSRTMEKITVEELLKREKIGESK